MSVLCWVFGHKMELAFSKDQPLVPGVQLTIVCRRCKKDLAQEGSQ